MHSCGIFFSSLKNERLPREKVVGLKQSLKAVEGERARLVFIARDADERAVGPLRVLCAQRGVEVALAPSMLALGKACGIQVGAAVAALTRTEGSFRA